jgi:4-aminobutyrate aminotransferase
MEKDERIYNAYLKKHPKTAKWIKRDAAAVAPCYTRGYPFVAESGRGVWLKDIEGKKFLDFNAGLTVTSVGQCHPHVVKAICDQARKLIHYSGTDFYYRPQIRLAEELVKITPGKFNKKVFFANSGAETVECALKSVRWHNENKNILALYHSFHGRTMGALSLTCSKRVHKERMGPFLDCVYHVPSAYCYRCFFDQTPDTCAFECMQFLDDFVTKTPVSGFVFEPIQGEGGYIVPPDGYYKRLKKVKKKHGFALVADEIQAGYGRTGKMCASEHWKLEPELVLFAKGIATGMPLGACVAHDKYMQWPPGAHANTFGGNPVACAAGLAVLDVFRKERVLQNVTRLGNVVDKWLKDMMEEHELIGDVRGKGLMQAFELVKDRKTKEYANKERNLVIAEAWKRGLLAVGAGKSVVRIAPPLIIKKEELEQGLGILDEALTAVEKAR